MMHSGQSATNNLLSLTEPVNNKSQWMFSIDNDFEPASALTTLFMLIADLPALYVDAG